MSDVKYLSVTEFAELHGADVGRIRLLIGQGRIPAIKIGKQWVIEAGTPMPADRRLKSGEYVGWRKETTKGPEA